MDNPKDIFRTAIIFMGLMYTVEYYYPVPFTVFGIFIISVVGIFSIWLGSNAR